MDSQSVESQLHSLGLHLRQQRKVAFWPSELSGKYRFHNNKEVPLFDLGYRNVQELLDKSELFVRRSADCYSCLLIEGHCWKVPVNPATIPKFVDLTKEEAPSPEPSEADDVDVGGGEAMELEESSPEDADSVVPEVVPDGIFEENTNLLPIDENTSSSTSYVVFLSQIRRDDVDVKPFTIESADITVGNSGVVDEGNEEHHLQDEVEHPQNKKNASNKDKVTAAPEDVAHGTFEKGQTALNSVNLAAMHKKKVATGLRCESEAAEDCRFQRTVPQQRFEDGSGKDVLAGSRKTGGEGRRHGHHAQKEADADYQKEYSRERGGSAGIPESAGKEGKKGGSHHHEETPKKKDLVGISPIFEGGNKEDTPHPVEAGRLCQKEVSQKETPARITEDSGKGGAKEVTHQKHIDHRHQKKTPGKVSEIPLLLDPPLVVPSPAPEPSPEVEEAVVKDRRESQETHKYRSQKIDVQQRSVEHSGKETEVVSRPVEDATEKESAAPQQKTAGEAAADDFIVKFRESLRRHGGRAALETIIAEIFSEVFERAMKEVFSPGLAGFKIVKELYHLEQRKEDGVWIVSFAEGRDSNKEEERKKQKPPASIVQDPRLSGQRRRQEVDEPPAAQRLRRIKVSEIPLPPDPPPVVPSPAAEPSPEVEKFAETLLAILDWHYEDKKALLPELNELYDNMFTGVDFKQQFYELTGSTDYLLINKISKEKIIVEHFGDGPEDFVFKFNHSMFPAPSPSVVLEASPPPPQISAPPPVLAPSPPETEKLTLKKMTERVIRVLETTGDGVSEKDLSRAYKTMFPASDFEVEMRALVPSGEFREVLAKFSGKKICSRICKGKTPVYWLEDRHDSDSGQFPDPAAPVVLEPPIPEKLRLKEMAQRVVGLLETRPCEVAEDVLSIAYNSTYPGSDFKTIMRTLVPSGHFAGALVTGSNKKIVARTVQGRTFYRLKKSDISNADKSTRWAENYPPALFGKLTQKELLQRIIDCFTEEILSMDVKMMEQRYRDKFGDELKRIMEPMFGEKQEEWMAKLVKVSKDRLEEAWLHGKPAIAINQATIKAEEERVKREEERIKRQEAQREAQKRRSRELQAERVRLAMKRMDEKEREQKKREKRAAKKQKKREKRAARKAESSRSHHKKKTHHSRPRTRSPKRYVRSMSRPISRRTRIIRGDETVISRKMTRCDEEQEDGVEAGEESTSRSPQKKMRIETIDLISDDGGGGEDDQKKKTHSRPRTRSPKLYVRSMSRPISRRTRRIRGDETVISRKRKRCDEEQEDGEEDREESTSRSPQKKMRIEVREKTIDLISDDGGGGADDEAMVDDE